MLRGCSCSEAWRVLKRKPRAQHRPPRFQTSGAAFSGQVGQGRDEVFSPVLGRAMKTSHAKGSNQLTGLFYATNAREAQGTQ